MVTFFLLFSNLYDPTPVLRFSIEVPSSWSHRWSLCVWNYFVPSKNNQWDSQMLLGRERERNMKWASMWILSVLQDTKWYEYTRWWSKLCARWRVHTVANRWFFSFLVVAWMCVAEVWRRRTSLGVLFFKSHLFFFMSQTLVSLSQLWSNDCMVYRK